MYLNYIELHGFKSFPDKIRINFDKGFTAVVGPNGSGKSNISDAVRWVLGEQSSKSLRGGKMEDVIFSGTQLRNAMGFASVTMSLSNLDKRLPVEGDEVLVSRRYYRSGDSEYLLNGTTVRLRDIHELFFDTGLGRDGYSLIGQGRIAEIVGARSTERREIFEEAAGIAKFRFRKNDADRRLAAAEDNLARIKDILGELEQRVGPLERQSVKAKQFLEYAGEKKGLEITLFCDEIRRKTEQIREHTDKLSIAKGDRDKLDQTLAEIRNSLDHNTELSRTHTARIDEDHRKIDELRALSTEYSSELSVIHNDVEHNTARIARLEGEHAAYGAQRDSVEDTAKLINTQADEKRAELAANDGEISLARDRLQTLILDNELLDRRRAETAEKIAALATDITELRVEAVSNTAAVEANMSRLEAVERSLSEQKSQKDASDVKLAGLRELQQKTDAALEQTANKINGFTRKLEDRKSEFDATQAKINSLTFASDEMEHKIKVLSDLESAMDGFAVSVKRVISAKKAKELSGIVGTVASLIDINAGCETAIETALGGAMQHIVVETERDAKAAIAYLKQSKSGRATFLPLDTIKPSRFDGNITAGRGGVVDTADKLVKFDPRYSDIISFLLGRIVVAEDMDSASSVARALNYRNRIVTLDGQLVNVGGSYTGGYIQKGASVLSRRADIDACSVRLKQIEKEKLELGGVLKSHSAAMAEINAELTALDADRINSAGEKIRVDAVIAEHERELGGWLRAYDELELEQKRLNEDNIRRQALAERAQKDLTDKQQRLSQLEQTADDTSSRADYTAERTKLQEALSELQIKRAELLKDVESLENSLTSLGARRDDAERLAAGLAAERDALTAMNDEKLSRAHELETMLAVTSDEIKNRQEDIEESARVRMLKEQEASGLRVREKETVELRDKSTGQVASFEAQLEALEAESKKFDDRLWEEYELTRIEAAKLCVPFESITKLRSMVGELRAKIKALGTVNLAAIEEYAEVSERYEFLKTQYEDVEKSRRELQTLIRSLTDEMRVIFEKSFAQINEKFQRVFIDLFGGGHAKLYLSDEGDILESGVEMDVQPPGKVIKNLASLSGGEQALVAIALYFAILAVNPSPFCVLDEIDSALDDANVARYADYLRRIMDKTQFIAITHRRGTMEAADMLYGVTMQEEGISKLLKLDIDNVDVDLVN